MSLEFVIPDLERELRALLAQIPAGKIATCGMLADALGSAAAAKWIGYFALHHRHDDACDCHRIVRARGELGGYVAGDPNAKIGRLEREGVVIEEGIVDLVRFGFENFASGYPLGKLREMQERLARKVSIRPRKRMPELIGGVDVAYPSAAEAAAAYALVETDTGRLVWSRVVRRSVRFPYISGFLSFRELPILLELIAEVRAAGKMAAALLVDGGGILHPRRAGAASHLGVAAAVPTIGVTKKMLCGKVDIEKMQPLESRPVLLDDRPVGAAIRPTSGSRRPIFISPGHRVDLPFAERVVRQFLRGRRLPEPLYWADRLSKKAEGKGEGGRMNDE
ncbi:MAG: endonuclease V [Pirellulales bacterium]|nr:endonuclease V [Pirellulales bacterium]